MSKLLLVAVMAIVLMTACSTKCNHPEATYTTKIYTVDKNQSIKVDGVTIEVEKVEE